MSFRALNLEGITRFGRWIDELRLNSTQSPPTELLDNAETSRAVEFQFTPTDKIFSNRVELGKWLTDALKDNVGTVLYDRGFWTALALFWFDQICAPRKDGSRKPGELARYILDTKRKSYRHLIWASWWAVSTYGDDGHYLLLPITERDYPLEFGGGEVMGQIAANQMTTASLTVIRLGRRLYEDKSTGRQSKGSGGKGPDSPRRFVQVLRQFQLTYEFEMMKDDDLAALMPKEFAKRLGI